VKLRGSECSNGLVVSRGDVADVRDEAVARIQGVEAAHDAVADDLRDDRRGSDGCTPRVAVHDRAVRRSGRSETEAVHETCLGRRMKVGQNRTHAREIRAVESLSIDCTYGNDPDADRRRARADGLEEDLPLLDRDLLRVIQRGERPYPRPPQELIVEKDARDHERPGEGAAPGLVGAGDEAHAEPAIESEKTLAAGARHAAETTS
jgi:hypothetical protein